MNKLVTGSRIFLGLVFAVFGFNHFVPFIPHPEMSGDALTYMTAKGETSFSDEDRKYLFFCQPPNEFKVS